LLAAGVSEATAMTITGHKDRKSFNRYPVHRDTIQAAALEQRDDYLARRRGTTPPPLPSIAPKT
jgi:hypothetical protein